MEYVKKFTAASSESKNPTPPAPVGEMKAIVWCGGKTVKVAHVPKPKIEDAGDVIVKVTACSICPGMCTLLCSGELPAVEKGQVLGHEGMGLVAQVGPDVKMLSVGDRVVMSWVIACGKCSHCQRQEYSACNCTNDSTEFQQKYGGWAPAATLGGSRLTGHMPGTQAEYVRVPYADLNCVKVPTGVPDDKALFAAGVASSALHATELGCVGKDDVVVIWGLGAVGLMTAQWAKLKGAKQVVGVDLVHERLEIAYDKFGLEVVDRTGLTSTELVAAVQSKLPKRGADVTIDACGRVAAHGWFQKVEKAIGVEDPSGTVLTECMTLTRKCGHVAVIGDYRSSVNGFPMGHMMMKQLTLRAGVAPVPKYLKKVMAAIEAGEVDPSMLVSHHLAMDDAPAAYQHACKKDQGYLKVVMCPSPQP